uniref:Ig-like domain-containing protein n=1 Tax=Fundulus heteroclitus TaxID=8078 RepID=A0A3Q2QX05_FUNHE
GTCFYNKMPFNYCLAVLIQTQQTVLAAVGEDAPLSCLFLETKDVQQVTWQKVFWNKVTNVGSYSEYFNETVNSDFKDKVQFIEAGLQKTSIVIRDVTEQDEGCYFCRFITFPDGALTAGTCLKVYGENQTVLQG